MKLTEDQVEYYRQNGYLLLESLFSRGEALLFLQEMQNVIREDGPRKILEKNGSVRSFFAPDHTNDLFCRIVRSTRLVGPAEQLIGTAVYAHQTKLNTKYAMVGDWWSWHRDYTFWQRDDGMPQPDVLTAMIFLNDVNEFNGPLLLIPGTHLAELSEREESNAPVTAADGQEWFREYQASASYMSALTADLKYTLMQHTIARWAQEKGIQSAKGEAGTVLFFHGNIFHASSNNLSPWDRHTFLVTYNSVKNTLPELDNPRPGFIANRVFEPIMPMADDFLQVTP